jgi:hypothetical protein
MITVLKKLDREGMDCSLPDVNANKFKGPRVARRLRMLTDKLSLHSASNDPRNEVVQ